MVVNKSCSRARWAGHPLVGEKKKHETTTTSDEASYDLVGRHKVANEGQDMHHHVLGHAV